MQRVRFLRWTRLRAGFWVFGFGVSIYDVGSSNFSFFALCGVDACMCGIECVGCMDMAESLLTTSTASSSLHSIHGILKGTTLSTWTWTVIQQAQGMAW